MPNSYDDDTITPLDPHVQQAANLLNSYYLAVPLDGWAASDLVELVKLIDTELQIRASNTDAQ